MRRMYRPESAVYGTGWCRSLALLILATGVWSGMVAAQGITRGRVLTPSGQEALAERPWPGPPVLSNQTISDKIDLELAGDPAVPAHRIDVTTRDGIVTLSGTVPNLLARSRAASVAETVKGVRAVVNRLEVNTPDRPDADVRTDIREALVLDPAATSYKVDVRVTGGKATLSGDVGSWSEKQLFTRLAEGLKGVRSVDNQLAIVYRSSRTDQDVRADVRSRLRWDRFVDDGMVDVEVRNGEVTLSGTVGSAAEKTAARSDAWAIGVSKVDDSGLQVSFWARDPRLRKDKYVHTSDSAIRDAVKNALLYDPRVDDLHTSIDVVGGIVTLHGEAGSPRGKRAAAETARHTVGVVSVRNLLKVRPANTATDGELEDRLETALRRDAYVDRYGVTARVLDGVAYLAGAVDTFYEKARAGSLAAAVPGVVAVRNNLGVESRGLPFIYNPYFAYDDGWPDSSGEWANGWNRPPATVSRADDEIRQAIEEELWWSPFVDSDDVTVEVDRGVATLEGTLDSRAERSAAVESAIEGGATRVVNRLKVGSQG